MSDRYEIVQNHVLFTQAIEKHSYQNFADLRNTQMVALYQGGTLVQMVELGCCMCGVGMFSVCMRFHQVIQFLPTSHRTSVIDGRHGLGGQKACLHVVSLN